MEVWTHRGELFELTSGYLLDDDAWAYEITPLSGDRVRSLAVLIRTRPRLDRSHG